MSADRDLSALLPEAPPPRPAGREAAVQAALRRFDSEPEAPRRAGAAAPGWRAAWRRPQIGVLIAASLVGVIALPVWLISDKRPLPAPAERAAMRDAVPPPTVSVPATPAAPLPQQAAAAPTAAAKPSPPAPSAKLAADEAAGQAAEAAPSAVVLAEPTVQLAPPPPPAAPPPPPMAAHAPERAAEADSPNVVVTARRVEGFAVQEKAAPRRQATASVPVLAASGSTACTIDDPRRSLPACGKELGTGAPGARGRSAAQVAEGLSRAWRGDLDRAVAAFDRAIALSPESAPAHYNRGLAFQRLGDAARARADLDRAATLDPRYRTR